MAHSQFGSFSEKLDQTNERDEKKETDAVTDFHPDAEFIFQTIRSNDIQDLSSVSNSKTFIASSASTPSSSSTASTSSEKTEEDANQENLNSASGVIHSTQHGLMQQPETVEQRQARIKFIKKWMNIEKANISSGLVKEKTVLQVHKKYALIQNDLLLSVAPSFELLMDIWGTCNSESDNSTSIASGTLKKLAIVSVTGDREISRDFNSHIFLLDEISKYGWIHVHLPWTDHRDDFVSREHLLKCVHQIQRLREQGYVVVVHGGMTNIEKSSFIVKERTAAAVLFLHQMIYNPPNHVKITRECVEDGKLNHGELIEIGNLLVETFNVLKVKLNNNGFAIDFIDDLPTDLNWDHISTAHDVNLFYQRKEYICCAQAMIFYYRLGKKMEATYQSVITPTLDQWIETVGFKKLKKYLVHCVNNNVISAESVNEFFNEFIKNFEKSKNYLVNQCVKDLDKGIRNIEENQKLFENKYRHSPIGKLISHFYKDSEFRKVLSVIHGDLMLYDKSSATPFQSPFLISATTNIPDEFLTLWNQFQERLEASIMLSKKGLSQDEKNVIKKYFHTMSRVDLLNNFILSMTYFFKKCYFDSAMSVQEQHNRKLKLKRIGFPFGVALSTLDPAITSKCIYLYFILFFLNHSDEKNLGEKYRNHLLNLFLEKTFDKQDNLIKKRYLVFTFDFIESNRISSDLENKQKTNDASDLFCFVYLFEQICLIEKRKKDEHVETRHPINHTEQISIHQPVFTPILKQLYEDTVKVIVGSVSKIPVEKRQYFYLDVQQEDDASGKAKFIFGPHANNDNLLKHPVILSMNHTILMQHQNSREQQIACLKEIVLLLMFKGQQQEAPSGLQGNSMFTALDQHRKHVLLSEEYLDRILSLIGVEKVSEERKVSVSIYNMNNT